MTDLISVHMHALVLLLILRQEVLIKAESEKVRLENILSRMATMLQKESYKLSYAG